MRSETRRVLVAFAGGSLVVCGLILLLIYLFVSRFYDRLSSGAVSFGALAMLCAPPMLTMAAGTWLATSAIFRAHVPWSRRKLLGATLIIGPLLLLDLLPAAAILFGIAGADLSIDSGAPWSMPVAIVVGALVLCCSVGLVLAADRDFTQL